MVFMVYKIYILRLETPKANLWISTSFTDRHGSFHLIQEYGKLLWYTWAIYNGMQRSPTLELVNS
jgi:hypothetical protein